MKIQYKVKPKSEWPLQVGDKIRIKDEWVDRLEQIDMNITDCREGEINFIYNHELVGEGYPECDFPNSVACNIELMNGNSWYAPLDCLERI